MKKKTESAVQATIPTYANIRNQVNRVWAQIVTQFMTSEGCVLSQYWLSHSTLPTTPYAIIEPYSTRRREAGTGPV